MLLTIILLLLISNALTLRKDKSILFSRVVMVSLIHTSFLAYNSLFFLPLDKVIGILGGLFHDTVFTQIFNIFIFLLSAIILTLTSFYPRKLLVDDNFFALLFSLLIIVSLKIPLKFMLSALGLDTFYLLVIIYSSLLVYCTVVLYKSKDYFSLVKLISIIIYCTTSYFVIKLIHPYIHFFLEEFITIIILPRVGLEIIGISTWSLFSNSVNNSPNGSNTSNEWRTSREHSVNHDESINNHLNKSRQTLQYEARLAYRRINTKASIIHYNVNMFVNPASDLTTKNNSRRAAEETFESITDDYHLFNSLNNTLVSRYINGSSTAKDTHSLYKQARSDIDRMG